MIRCVLLLLTILPPLLIRCSYNAGASSEVEGMIQGRAIFDENDPAVDATVRLRPLGFLALEDEPFIAVNTTSGAKGVFVFDTLPEGTYVIEINYETEFGALQTFSITSSDTFPMTLPTVTLTRTGTIYGRVNLPISDDTARPWVALYNVDRLIQTPITQDFKFEGIPEGNYNLRIVPYRESNLVVEVHDIIVISDSVIDIGTMNLTMQPFFKGCASFECDSIAVRTILDENGLDAVTVAQACSTDATSGRITTLDLAGQELIDLTRNIGSLSELTVLDVRDNELAVLPKEIGYLRNLKKCYLDTNQLSYLPMELSYCNSLETLTLSGNQLRKLSGFMVNLPVSTLDLSNNFLSDLPATGLFLPNIRSLYLHANRLSELPEALIQKDLDDFTIANNRLCITSVSLEEWLTSNDEDWAATQECSNEQSPE
jgi:Leucine-rich repeat (LRR) protein